MTLQAKLVPIMLSILVLSGVFLWVKSISNDRDRLGKALAQEQVLHQVTKKSVGTLIEEVNSRNEEINRLNKQFARIRTSTRATVSIFDRHNLSYLALKKPGLISNRINAATIKRLLWVEELTSAYSEGRDPRPDGETHARAGKLAASQMDNYRGPLFCTDSKGYEDIARMTTELDRYIQQLHQRCK